MQSVTSIVWFKQDLRLSDNSAVTEGSNSGAILPIYILDDTAPDLFKIGASSKIWLHHSLEKLNKSLDGKLNIYIGESDKIIDRLIKQHNICNVFYNKCYELWHLKQESDVLSVCRRGSINFKSFNSNYLRSPSEVLKDDGTYYKVFTAYKNKSYKCPMRQITKNAQKINAIKDLKNKTSISDLKLIPQNKQWHKKIMHFWDVGEIAAQNKLSHFIENHLSEYKDGRNYPIKNQTSLLSPHLHFGEISPSQICKSISILGHLHSNDSDIEHFLSEIMWREFSCYLLHHVKLLHQDNFNKKFDRFPWQDNLSCIKAWQTGHTGYPIVDAGMRQLWQTGYMHNRVRMIVASFLVKNLNIHWHKGRDWFWDCLVDADLANNSASWQWVAGCGADSAPYFRIFNPITQGEKFDKHGEYTREFIPELKKLPDKYLFKPWSAPSEVLKSADIILGETYPNPIVDVATSRNEALKRYKKL